MPQSLLIKSSFLNCSVSFIFLLLVQSLTKTFAIAILENIKENNTLIIILEAKLSKRAELILSLHHRNREVLLLPLINIQYLPLAIGKSHSHCSKYIRLPLSPLILFPRQDNILHTAVQTHSSEYHSTEYLYKLIQKSRYLAAEPILIDLGFRVTVVHGDFLTKDGE